MSTRSLIGFGGERLAMGETFSQALRRRREEAGLSQPKLARAVHFTQTTISKVENGHMPPSRDFAEACDKALHASGALVALAPAPPPDQLEELETWELADVLTRTRISPQVLTHMERSVFGYAYRYPSSTPADLLPLVRQQLRRLKEGLAHPQPLGLRRQSVTLLGVLCGLSGNLLLDQGDELKADSYFDVAALAAEEAENDDMAAWVLATRSIIPFFGRRTIEAADMLDHAATLAVNTSSLRRQSWVLAMRARAHAALGDARTSLSSLDQASAVMARVTDPPSGTDFFDAPRLDGIRGSCLMLLQDTGGAHQVLSQAIDSRAPGDLKGRALLILDLAACRLTEHDVDEASRLARHALTLARGAVVTPIISRAHALRGDMGPWEGTRAVVELDDQLAESTRVMRSGGVAGALEGPRASNRL